MSSGSRWEHSAPPLEAYSRVTDAERFMPLHTAMMDLILRLETAFHIERVEGYGLDEELEKPFNLARSSRGGSVPETRMPRRFQLHFRTSQGSTCALAGGVPNSLPCAAATHAMSLRKARSNG